MIAFVKRKHGHAGMASDSLGMSVKCIGPYAAVQKTDHHKTVAVLLPQPEPPAPVPEATARAKMAHRLKTNIGKKLYKLCKQTVEPVFGIIKEVMEFRRFSLRGRASAGHADPGA